MNKYEIKGLLHSAQSHKIQHYKKNKGYFKQHYEKFNGRVQGLHRRGPRETTRK